MRKELFRNAYEIQHDISLVFASIVLLAWEGKNECPSHMTLLYQQKLCRNNYADEDFGGLAFIIQRNQLTAEKLLLALELCLGLIFRKLCPCAHTSTLTQLPAILSFKQSPNLPFLSSCCSYCMVTHHPLSAPFDILHIFSLQIFSSFLTIPLQSFQQLQEMHTVIPHSTKVCITK